MHNIFPLHAKKTLRFDLYKNYVVILVELKIILCLWGNVGEPTQLGEPIRWDPSNDLTGPT